MLPKKKIFIHRVYKYNQVRLHYEVDYIVLVLVQCNQCDPFTEKSHVAIALGMGVMQQGYSVRFVLVMQLI